MIRQQREELSKEEIESIIRENWPEISKFKKHYSLEKENGKSSFYFVIGKFNFTIGGEEYDFNDSILYYMDYNEIDYFLIYLQFVKHRDSKFMQEIEKLNPFVEKIGIVEVYIKDEKKV